MGRLQDEGGRSPLSHVFDHVRRQFGHCQLGLLRDGRDPPLPEGEPDPLSNPISSGTARNGITLRKRGSASL
ncbi:hypothetical protein GCM10010358_19200 [Streptomyces minutiscleroticus]|uniref:Uncharacterized protein n=1 Tax=Streptomyces minutiscleroticus TaxID=68238 RepID=A0A918KJK6_9ACTN|nr:hypothetical protein GCM10010358_19200 [Streptomyces minutiscleroticus]